MKVFSYRMFFEQTGCEASFPFTYKSSLDVVDFYISTVSLGIMQPQGEALETIHFCTAYPTALCKRCYSLIYAVVPTCQLLKVEQGKCTHRLHGETEHYWALEQYIYLNDLASAEKRRQHGRMR